MSPTMDFELVIVGIGILVAILAMRLHSSEAALAGLGIAVLAVYAVWLERRR